MGSLESPGQGALWGVTTRGPKVGKLESQVRGPWDLAMSESQVRGPWGGEHGVSATGALSWGVRVSSQTLSTTSCSWTLGWGVWSLSG